MADQETVPCPGCGGQGIGGNVAPDAWVGACRTCDGTGRVPPAADDGRAE